MSCCPNVRVGGNSEEFRYSMVFKIDRSAFSRCHTIISIMK